MDQRGPLLIKAQRYEHIFALAVTKRLKVAPMGKRISGTSNNGFFSFANLFIYGVSYKIVPVLDRS